MNYEKIIVELLARIQTLEEQVATLMENQEEKKEKAGEKMTMHQIREYIRGLKRQSKEQGESTLVLRSGNIHKDLGLVSAMPAVCNAMRQCMEENDIILHTTPSGNSSTIEIRYYL